MSVSRTTLDSISTPDRVETKLGTLTFDHGAPSKETAQLLYDNLDLMNGVQAFLGAFPGASVMAMRRGLLSIGVEDNSFLVFSDLMDSASLFLTANCDTVYFIGIVDLTSGPMVVETPPHALGIFDDMRWRWIIDFGLPGPDRGDAHRGRITSVFATVPGRIGGGLSFASTRPWEKSTMAIAANLCRWRPAGQSATSDETSTPPEHLPAGDQRPRSSKRVRRSSIALRWRSSSAWRSSSSRCSSLLASRWLWSISVAVTAPVRMGKNAIVKRIRIAATPRPAALVGTTSP